MQYTQQILPEQTQQHIPNENDLKKTGRTKGQLFLYGVIGLATFLIISTALFLLQTQSIIPNNKSVESKTGSPQSVPISPSPAPLFKTATPQNTILYTNSTLGFSFAYQNTEDLYECPQNHCLSIDRITLRVDTLPSDRLLTDNIQQSLLLTDLNCAADGPGISISCANTRVESFTNLSGSNGFKVSRTKTITGNSISPPAGEYSDMVYVYILPKTIQGIGLLDYAAIMFAVDTPTPENHAELEKIAYSFKLL